jgi:hypothetical protein
MVYYRNLKSRSIEDILNRASQDAENWNKEERKALQTIAKGLQTRNELNKKEEEICMEWPDDTEERLDAIQLQKENLSKRISWWELQGNQGMALRDNKQSFAFKVVGYDDHEGYFTPGVGLFDC